MPTYYKNGKFATSATDLPKVLTDGTSAPTGVSFTQTPSGSVYILAASATSPTGILRYEWDYGDGTTAIGPSVRKNYPRPGIYTVKLTAIDRAYRRTTYTGTITVLATVADYFNRADNTSTLGSASDGTTTKAWSVLPSGSAFGIKGNMAKPTAGTATAVATVDTGTAGGTVQADAGVLQMDHNRTPLIVFRFVDMSNFWFVQLPWLTNGFSVRLIKKVAGTNTTLFTNDMSIMQGDTIKVTDSANLIKLYVNNLLIFSNPSDTSLNTATKVGIGSNYAVDTTSAWDNFAYWAN